jgi:HlyD family secretion protein
VGAVAGCAVLAGCDRDPDDVLLGTLERDRVELVAEVNEPIVAIDAREGEHLAAGQRVLRQDRAAVGERLAAARAAEAQARQRLDELVEGPRREEILEAGAARDSAAARALAEEQEFTRVSALVARQLLPAADLDRQRALRDAAAAEQRRTEAGLKLLIRGTRAEQIEQARSAYAAAGARTRELEVTAGRLDVRAPVPGLLDDLPYEIGERPSAGATVAVLLADGAPWARIYVPEPRRAAVRVGTPAEVRVDGVDRAFRGRVRYLSSEAAFTPYYALTQRERARLAFPAEVELTEPEAASLSIGVPAQVRLLDATAGP